MALDLGTLYYNVEANTTDLDRADARMNSAAGSARKLGSESDRATKQMRTGFGGAATAIKTASAALAAFGVMRGVRAVIDDVRQFEQAISNLSAITGATGEDLKFLSDQAKEIGRTTTLSASQAASAFKLIASAKPDLLESADALNAVTREAVLLAEAAGVELTQAASTVGTSLNQFGAGAEEASRFVNVLAAGAKFGASEIQQTALALKNSGAAANSAGLSFEETNAAIQALASGGIRAAEAGTGLRNILLILEQEADTGLRPSMVGVGQAIENLADKQLSLTEMTEIFGRENAVAAQTLIDQSDNLSALIPKLTGTSTATEQAARNFDNLDGDVRRAGSATEALTIALGERLNPVFRSVTQGYADVVSGLAEMISGSEEAAERTEKLKQAMSDAGIEASEYGQSLEFVVEQITRLLEGERMLSEHMASQGGAAITNNAELMEWINNQYGEGARQVAFYEENLLNVIGVQGLLGDELAESITNVSNLSDLTDQFTDALRQHRKELDATAESTEEARKQVSLWGEDLSKLPEWIAPANRSYEAMRERLDEIKGSLDSVTDNVFEFNDTAEDTEFRMQGVTDGALSASDASKELADATDETTDAMRAQERMLEGIQRSWADMFYEMDLTANGFFDSVIDGFRRMLAEMAAADLVNATFGGQGMSAITGGNTAQGLGNIAGLFGGGGGGVGVGGMFEAAGAGGVNPMTLGQAGAAGSGGIMGAIGSAMPYAAAAMAAYQIGSALDSGGTMSANAGLLVGPGGGREGRAFDIDAFESGFQGRGVARRTEQAAAEAVIDRFRAVDSAIVQAVNDAGGQIDLSQATLGGFSEQGRGNGVFLGEASEEGEGVTSLPMEQQLDMFARQVIAHVEGLDDELTESLKSATSAEEMFGLLSQAVDQAEESAAEAAAAEQERYGLQTRLLQLQGDTEALRERELDQLDESNRGLLERIFALQDEQDAAEKAERAARDYRRELQGQVREQSRALEEIHAERMAGLEDERAAIEQSLSESRSAVDAALSDMRRTMGERMESIRAQADESISAVQAEREAVSATYAQTADDIQRSMSGVSDSISDLRSRADMLAGAVGRFSDTSISGRSASRSRAMQTLQGAGSGTSTDVLQSAIDTLSGDTSGLFSTLAEQQSEAARAGNLIAGLRDETESQLSVEERTLQSLQERAEEQEQFEAQALERYDAQIESIEAQRDQQIAGIEEQLAIAQGQVDALNGVSNNVATLSDVTRAITTYEQQLVMAEKQQAAIDREMRETEKQHDAQMEAYASLLEEANQSKGSLFQIEMSNRAIAEEIGSLEAALGGAQSFSGGGIATGPSSGYMAQLHGTEGVVPMDNGYIPVRIDSPMTGMAANDSGMSQVRGELREISRELSQIRNNTGDGVSYMRRWNISGLKTQEVGT